VVFPQQAFPVFGWYGNRSGYSPQHCIPFEFSSALGAAKKPILFSKELLTASAWYT